MADSTYVIKPRPPVRAFLIAAVTSLIGAAVLVLALLNQWHVAVAVLGGVVIALGVGLLLLGLVSMGQRQVLLTFDDDGYRLESSHGSADGNWSDVTRVTQSNDGQRVTIFEGDDVRHSMVFTPGATAQLERVLEDMSARLDKAKGYRNF